MLLSGYAQEVPWQKTLITKIWSGLAAASIALVLVQILLKFKLTNNWRLSTPKFVDTMNQFKSRIFLVIKQMTMAMMTQMPPSKWLEQGAAQRQWPGEIQQLRKFATNCLEHAWVSCFELLFRMCAILSLHCS